MRWQMEKDEDKNVQQNVKWYKMLEKKDGWVTTDRWAEYRWVTKWT